jgi:uncharacterized membrane protein YcaP (DUF421 family)
MLPQDIHLTDWMRILVGEVPTGFYFELLIRAVAVYLILLVSIRSMGKRMSSQLSRAELAALVSLAAAVGIPMMAPDRGILPAIVIAFVLITVERLMALQSCKSQKFESFAQGNISTLISDGVVNMKALKQVSLSHERVFAQLRSQEVLHLGSVSRFYMEANGTFTLVSRPEPMPGLCTLPPWDHEMLNRFTEHTNKQICVQCGFPQKSLGNPYPACPNCGAEKWVNAVLEVSSAND